MKKSPFTPRLVDTMNSEHEEAQMDDDASEEQLLEAVAADLRTESVTMEDLDQDYTRALAAGIVSESDLQGALSRFLDRTAMLDPSTNSVTLERESRRTLGVCIAEYARRRKLNIAHLAKEMGASLEQAQKIQASSELFDVERLDEIASAIAQQIGVDSALSLHTFLQRVRVTLGMAGELGPVLQAARRPPGT